MEKSLKSVSDDTSPKKKHDLQRDAVVGSTDQSNSKEVPIPGLKFTGGGGTNVATPVPSPRSFPWPNLLTYVVLPMVCVALTILGFLYFLQSPKDSSVQELKSELSAIKSLQSKMNEEIAAFQTTISARLAPLESDSHKQESVKATENASRVPEMPMQLTIKLESIEGLDKIANNLTQVLDRLAAKLQAENDSTDLDKRVADALDPFTKRIVKSQEAMEASLKILANRFTTYESMISKQAKAEEVSLVLFHSNLLNAKTIQSYVSKVIESGGFKNLYQNYRLGVFLASNSKVETELLSRTSKSITFPAIQDVDDKYTESIDRFLPSGLFKNAVESVPKRVVIVASNQAKPPSDLKAWEAIPVKVVLVSKDGSSTAEHLELWKKFCGPEGVQVVGPPSATDDGKVFGSTLEAFLRPRE